ncbi:hypothetical protein TeGR_g6936 [Tetraparma gracilis]|uniref:SGNH hydrolase-type esterase domain-containing protein n=1 Tax=Tetraparma gracilis TaxID=2962635 RepID=A0ABQ6MXB9_9STRA|nr:hypothetical protein TeGR_g6936 [Tetraparma gracilis]
MFFGDSTMDVLKYDAVALHNGRRATSAWGAFVGGGRGGDALDLSRLSVANKGMSGAPAVELCCAAPCVALPPRFRAAQVAVASAGGNDFLWYPLPGCCEAQGGTLPVRCGALPMLRALAGGGAKRRVVWLVDEGVATVLPRGRGSGYYGVYSQEIMKRAGTVVTPRVRGESNADVRNTCGRLKEHLDKNEPGAGFARSCS